MALPSRKPSTVQEQTRLEPQVQVKQRSVGLTCVLVLAYALLGILACEDRPDPGFFTEIPLPPTALEPIYDPAAFPRSTLDNGLKTILLENPSAAMVNLTVRVRRGAASVDVERAGLAKFTAALMRRGAGGLEARAFAQSVKELSAVLTINAKWDAIAVKITGPPQHIERYVEILGDVVLRPLLSEEQTERTRRLQITAIRTASDRPRGLQGRFTPEMLYPNHRVGLPLDGTEAAVSAITAEDVRKFHSEIFVPNNAMLFGSGAFDADEVLSLVTQTFGAWAPGPPVPEEPPYPSPAPDSRRILIVDRPDLVQGSHVLLAHDNIARGNPDRTAVHLLTKVVELRAILTASGRLNAFRGGATYTLSTVTHSSKVRRVIDLLLSELEGVREQPIAEPELDLARSLVLRRFVKLLGTQNAILSSLVELDNYEMPEDSLDAYRSRLVDMTVEDLQRDARRLLHPDRAAILLIGPAEILLPQLDGLGPVEVIQYPPVPEAPPAADDGSAAVGEDAPAAADE